MDHPCRSRTPDYYGDLTFDVVATGESSISSSISCRQSEEVQLNPPRLADIILLKTMQTLSSASLQTIAAGRLAAIVTVFRQLILQFLDQLLLRSQLLLQNQNQLDQSLLV